MLTKGRPRPPSKQGVNQQAGANNVLIELRFAEFSGLVLLNADASCHRSTPAPPDPGRLAGPYVAYTFRMPDHPGIDFESGISG